MPPPSSLYDRNRLFEIGRGRLLAIDVLTGVERPGQQTGTAPRRRGIEEYGVSLLGERSVEIGGPALHRKALGERLEFRRIAANQHGIGHDAGATGQLHATLVANRDD